MAQNLFLFRDVGEWIRKCEYQYTGKKVWIFEFRNWCYGSWIRHRFLYSNIICDVFFGKVSSTSMGGYRCFCDGDRSNCVLASAFYYTGIRLF